MKNNSRLYKLVAGKYNESKCLSIINAIDIPNSDFKSNGENLLNLEEFHTLFIDRRNKFNAVFFFAENGVYYICHKGEELNRVKFNLGSFEDFIDAEIISSRAVRIGIGAITRTIYTLETEEGEMEIVWTGDKDAYYSNDTRFYFISYDQLNKKPELKSLEDVERITKKVFKKYRFSDLSKEEFRKVLVNELTK